MNSKKALWKTGFLIGLGILVFVGTILAIDWQCSPSYCQNICWCQGSHIYVYSSCCGYCYNQGAGGWLDCCTGVCYPINP